MNPYTGTTFTSYFVVLCKRLWLLITGELPFCALATDEVQLFVLIALSIATSSIGVFLVLKRMTMLANSLSHTILFGIVLAYLFLSPFSSGGGEYILNFELLFLASLITGIITALCTQLLTHLIKLQEDASIGIVFTTFFALGIVLVTIFTRDAHIGTEVIMGNVDALQITDFKLIGVVALINILVILAFFKEFQITAFDPMMAATLGIFPAFFNYFLTVLTAGTAIGSFRAVGVLLFLAFLVAPVLTARHFTDRLKPLLFLSIGIAIVGSSIGAALSRHFLTVYQMPLSTAGMVVTLLGILYLVGFLCSPKRGLFRYTRA